MSMSRHYHVHVATLGQCHHIGENRCHDIEKEFYSFKQKIFTCFPHFISAISVHAREYKSINIKESQFKHEL